MKLYIIKTKENPLMIKCSANEEIIERYVKRFPQKLNVTYQEINSEEAKRINTEINDKLATILIKKYGLTFSVN